jgi:hypothetical protein
VNEFAEWPVLAVLLQIEGSNALSSVKHTLFGTFLLEYENGANDSSTLRRPFSP